MHRRSRRTHHTLRVPSPFGLIFIDTTRTNHEHILLERVVKAPITESFRVLCLDYSNAEKILEKHNIEIGAAKTIEEIGARNSISAKEIVELIIE